MAIDGVADHATRDYLCFDVLKKDFLCACFVFIIFPMHRVRYNDDGHARYLTFSCYHNQNFFLSERACLWFGEALVEARKQYGFSLWAYVIMPNHVHLLILPKKGIDVSNILLRCKRPVTDKALAWMRKNNPERLNKMMDRQPNGKTSFRFWQRGGGYDRNIFSDEEAHEKLRYIHNNPVKAKLAENCNDWKWSSYNAWQTGIDEPIAIDREYFPMLDG